MRTRALRYGTECTLGYLDLLEHVLVVRRGVGRAGAGEELSILSLGKSHLELHASSTCKARTRLSQKASHNSLLQLTRYRCRLKRGAIQIQKDWGRSGTELVQES